MIVDFEYLGRDDLPPVVIVGSGPAGVTLAWKLARNGVGSIVLEGGEDSLTEASQDLYAGRVVGDPYYDLDATRLRFFGGSSNHWAGWCRPLDPIDFERRPEIPDTGWPISKADLDPYAEEAAEILEIGAMRSRSAGPDLVEVEYAFSPPVVFGQKYRDFFAGARDTHLVLGANVVSLRAESGRIAEIEVDDLKGRRLSIAPGRVVLATGGIENSRLLLWSNEVSPERVVAEPAALGRYWMEHPHSNCGESYLLPGFNRFLSPMGAILVAPSEAAMRRYGILNGVLRIYPSFADGPGTKTNVKRAICATRPVGPAVLDRLDARITCTTTIKAQWEQAPEAVNRVALSETDRDALGMPRTVLHWAKQPFDYRTVKVVFELWGRHLVDRGLGQARAFDCLIEGCSDPEDTQYGGHHHMGGTRMSASPAKGVVDRDLRIHGLANGHVLGSSVFPTGGYANPTFTIVQLALRLGDCLSRA